MIDKKQVIYDIERCICRVPDACRDCSKYDPGDCNLNCMKELLKDAMDALKEKPEIVRCKDCKYGAYVAQVGTLPLVTCGGVDHELNWFCADGERW